MESIILKIAPILFIFALGISLRRVNLFTEESADTFLKFVFYVSAPASILISITKIEISIKFVYLPIISALMIIIAFLAARILSRYFNLSRPTLGVFLVGSMIINTGFIYPFLIAVYGMEGFARSTLFDLGNIFLVLTFVYFIAVKHGNHQGPTEILKKFLSSSPLWALFIALTLNFAHIKLPLLIDEFLKALSNTLIPLYMISLGIRFNPKIINYKALISVISIRMFLGLLLGFIFVLLFRLKGLNRIVVLICSAAPVGINTLTFATMEELDVDFAASLVSISILIGIILTTVLLLCLS